MRRGKPIGCEGSSQYINWVQKNGHQVVQDEDGKWITINKRGVKVTLKS